MLALRPGISPLHHLTDASAALPAPSLCIESYHKLGLVGDFSLRDSGGAAIPNAPRLGSIHEAKNAQQATVPSAGRAGMATVERDAEGNVVAIHEPGSGRADTAWGQALNSDDSDSEEQDDRGAEQSSAAAPQGKEMWTALEDAAQSAKPVERFASEGERGWLHRLVATHGTDTAAMSRDAGANVWQKTEGEIKRAIRKAGGFNALQPAA